MKFANIASSSTVSKNPIRIRTFVIAIFCACTTILFARDRSVEEMEQIAKSAMPATAQTRAKIKGYEQDFRTLYELPSLCVLGYTEGGFAVIARDDRHRAVWGYSDAPFDTDDISPEFEWLMRMFDNALKTNAVNESIPEVGNNDASSSLPLVAPLIKTKWGQRDPFNRYCPKIITDEGEVTCVAGCGPTALAQLVNYYGTPTRGMGHGSYQTSNLNRYTVDLRDWSWDFTKMLPEYTTTDGVNNFSDEQADEVARLMFACGAAYHAVYAVDGTASHQINERSFGYETTFFKLVTDKEKITELLDRGIPLHVGADASAGEFEGLGHYFLLDGYDDREFIHCNFGWNGKQDGYYAITDLNNFNRRVEMLYFSETNNQLIQGPGNLWYYLKNNTNEAWVTKDNTIYPKTYGTDNVIVPSYIYQNDEMYKVTTIEGGAFAVSDNSIITLPETIEKFHWFSMSSNFNVKALYCTGITPPTPINFPPFFSKNLKVYALPEALKKYKDAFKEWEYIEVYPFDEETNISSVPRNPSDFPTSYDLFGRPDAANHKGICITNGRKEIRE